MPRAKKPDAAPDPDKLVRSTAGRYITPDERFEVRQGDVGWFVVDTAITNEFGQELIHGPFATLKAAGAAIPSARDSKVQPTRAPRARATEAGAREEDEKPQPKPKPKPPSWIDRLAASERRRVRALITALELEGVVDAESLVRRDLEGLFPAVATALIESRLDALVDEAPSHERTRTKELVRRVAEILTAEGTALREPLPGWSLVEIGPEPQPGNRRIDLSE